MTTAIIFLLVIIFIFKSFHFWWDNYFDVTISSRWLALVVLVLYLIEKFY